MRALGTYSFSIITRLSDHHSIDLRDPQQLEEKQLPHTGEANNTDKPVRVACGLLDLSIEGQSFTKPARVYSITLHRRILSD